MKAVLHFHPSFFNPESGWHWFEWGKPNLVDIVKRCVETKTDVLTITSCADKRFDYYAKQLDKLGNMHEIEYDDKNKIIKMDDIYLINGIEVKCREGDANLIGIKRIPDELVKTGLLLEEALGMGRELGSINSVRYNKTGGNKANLTNYLRKKELLDCIDAYDALDPSEARNEFHKNLARGFNIPGIAVSDGHRLRDIDASYVSYKKPDENYKGSMVDYLREIIEKKKFKNVEFPISSHGRFKYSACVAEAIGRAKLGKN